MKSNKLIDIINIDNEPDILSELYYKPSKIQKALKPGLNAK